MDAPRRRDEAPRPDQRRDEDAPVAADAPDAPDAIDDEGVPALVTNTGADDDASAPSG